MSFYKTLNKKELEELNNDTLKHYLEMYNLSKEVQDTNYKNFFDEIILEEASSPILSIIPTPKHLKENIKRQLISFYTKEKIEKLKLVKEFLEK